MDCKRISAAREEKRAVKKNAKQLKGIAVFSDDIRDALKGSWMHYSKYRVLFPEPIASKKV